MMHYIILLKLRCWMKIYLQKYISKIAESSIPFELTEAAKKEQIETLKLVGIFVISAIAVLLYYFLSMPPQRDPQATSTLV